MQTKKKAGQKITKTEVMQLELNQWIVELLFSFRLPVRYRYTSAKRVIRKEQRPFQCSSGRSVTSNDPAQSALTAGPVRLWPAELAGRWADTKPEWGVCPYHCLGSAPQGVD